MSDSFPLSLAIVNVRSVPPVAFANVTEGISSNSFCKKDLPLWFLRTRVYTCSLVRAYTPVDEGVNSTPFLSMILEIGPEAAELVPTTTSPLVTNILPEAKHLRNVSGVRVFSVPGTIFLAGLSKSTLVM